MRIDPSVSYKDLVLGGGGIPQVVDKSGKLYIEYNIPEIYPYQKNEYFQGFPYGKLPGYLIFQHVTNVIGWDPKGDIGFCWTNGTTFNYVTTSPTYQKAGRYGYGFDYDSNIMNFFFNGTLFYSINLGARADLKTYIFSPLVGETQTIFRSDFPSIPDGYTVLGDLMPTMSIEDRKDILWSYK